MSSWASVLTHSPFKQIWNNMPFRIPLEWKIDQSYLPKIANGSFRSTFCFTTWPEISETWEKTWIPASKSFAVTWMTLKFRKVKWILWKEVSATAVRNVVYGNELASQAHSHPRAWQISWMEVTSPGKSIGSGDPALINLFEFLIHSSFADLRQKFYNFNCFIAS